MFKLLKITRRDLFLTRQLCRGHYLGAAQGENSEIQNAVFPIQNAVVSSPVALSFK